MKELLFINSYPGDKDAFSDKVRAVSSRLGINPNWLMATMNKESKLNPQARNTAFPVQGGYATGLIQFTPDTARALGTTTSDLYSMGGVEQLDYVEKYFRSIGAAGRMRSYFDVYIAVFFPAAIGYKDTDLIQTRKISASKIAQQNPAIDLNKDGVITVAEFKEYLVKGFSSKAKKLLEGIKQGAVDNLLPLAAFIALIYAYNLKK